MNAKYLMPIFFLLAVSFPITGFCTTPVLTWKSTYYQSIPNQKNISPIYCQQHEPGTFVGVVNDQLANGAITNTHIKLDHFTFHEKINHGIYFMQGTLIAHGISAGKSWNEPINYYVYKLTEDGITYGVWSSQTCKGLYLGEVVKKWS